MDPVLIAVIVGTLVFFLWKWYNSRKPRGSYGSEEEMLVYNNTSLELSVNGKPLRPRDRIRATRGSRVILGRGDLFGIVGGPNIVEITGSYSRGRPSVTNNTGVDVYFNFISADGNLLYTGSVRAFDKATIDLNPDKLLNSVFATGVFDPLKTGTDKDFVINSVIEDHLR